MDETGTFTVQGVKSVPKGKPCLSPGTHTPARSVVRGNVALITESSGTLSGRGPTKITPERAPLLAAAVGRVL